MLTAAASSPLMLSRLNGMLLLDKPTDSSSAQVLNSIKAMMAKAGLKRREIPKIGHGGTLDPFATGVLPLMAGRCMKITNKILKHKKTYIAVFRFRSMPD